MRRNTLFYLFMAAIACLGGVIFTGCSSDDISEKRDYISFTPMDIGFQKFENHKGTTRAQSDPVSSYGVTCSVCELSQSYTDVESGSYFYNEEILAENGRCNFLWPTDMYKISFFAYAPYGNSLFKLSSAKTKTGRPTYSYTVPANPEQHIDVITAEVLDMKVSEKTGPVSLNFSHRCSDVRFVIKNRNPVDGLTVKSVTLCGMKYSGTLEGDTWSLSGQSNSSSSYPFTLTANTNIGASSTVDVTGTSKHFIVLPQTISTGTEFLVIKTVEYGQEKTYSNTLNADFSLVAGKSYTFNVTLGLGEMVVDSDTDIRDWEVEVKYLNAQVGSDNGIFTQPTISNGESISIEDWIAE